MFNLNLDRLVCNLNCAPWGHRGAGNLRELAEHTDLQGFANIVMGHVLTRLQGTRCYIYTYTGHYQLIASTNRGSLDDLSREQYVSFPLYHKGQFTGTLGVSWSGRRLPKMHDLLDPLAEAIDDAHSAGQI